MKAESKNTFLSGVRKVISNRQNTDEGLAKLFYDYKFVQDGNLVKN
jgi:hypothetical protein